MEVGGFIDGSLFLLGDEVIGVVVVVDGDGFLEVDHFNIVMSL